MNEGVIILRLVFSTNMNPITAQDNKKISKGFVVASIIFLLSILNTLLYLGYSQGSVSIIIVIWLGITFSIAVFGVVYSFTNSYHKSEKENMRLNILLKNQEKRMKSLYDISLTSQEKEINKLYEKILIIGTQSLGLEIGLIAKIEGNNYSVLSSIGEDSIGGKDKVLDFAKTCCGITYYANEIILLDNMQKSLFQNHPARTYFKIESYVGTPLVINKRKFGTINFFSLHPKNNPYNELDREFIQLMAKIICITIEHALWLEKLKSNNEELEWLNKIKIGRELRMIELKREIANLRKQTQSVSQSSQT